MEKDETAQLECAVDSKPTVSTVKWTRNGRFIDTHFKHTIPRVTLQVSFQNSIVNRIVPLLERHLMFLLRCLFCLLWGLVVGMTEPHKGCVNLPVGESCNFRKSGGLQAGYCSHTMETPTSLSEYERKFMIET